MLAVPCVKSVQIRNYFWSVFSCIRTEYGDLRSNSVFGHSSRSGSLFLCSVYLKINPRKVLRNHRNENLHVKMVDIQIELFHESNNFKIYFGSSYKIFQSSFLYIEKVEHLGLSEYCVVCYI